MLHLHLIIKQSNYIMSTKSQIFSIDKNEKTYELVNIAHIGAMLKQKYSIEEDVTVNFVPDAMFVPYKRYKLSQKTSPQFIAALIILKTPNKFVIYSLLGIIDSIDVAVIKEDVFYYGEPNSVREVCFMPNHKDVLYFYQSGEVRKFQIISNSASNYTLSEHAKFAFSLPEEVSVSQAKALPSGKFVILTAQKKDSSAVMMKISAETGGSSPIERAIDQPCIKKGLLSQESFDIDSTNQDIMVSIGNFTNTICVWNTSNLTLSSSYNLTQDQLKYLHNAVPPEKSETLKIRFVKFVKKDQAGGSYLLATDSIVYSHHYFRINYKTSILEYNQSFLFLEGNTYWTLKAVEIPEIDTVAIAQLNQAYTSLVKSSLGNDSIASLDTDCGSQINDFFYFSSTNSLCLFNQLPSNQTIVCSEVMISPDKTKPTQSINELIGSCNSKQYWNAISWTCQTCLDSTGKPNNCQCSENYQSINQYTGECQLNCSYINHAIDFSEYNNNEQCVCQEGFTWYDSKCLKPSDACSPGYVLNANSQCTIDCSQIQYAVPQNKVNSTSNSCQCINGFIFMVPSNKQIGRCEIQCDQNATTFKWAQGKPLCPCPKNQEWDSSQLRCISNGEGGLPGWAIFLIVLFCLITVAVGAYLFCYCRKKKSKGRVNRTSTGTTEKFTDRNLNDENISNKKNHSEEVHEKTCSVCHEAGINCEGPCGHAYHFGCIKNKIDSGEADCPECFQVFHNGLADIRIVQNQSQVFTIEESD